MKAVRNESEERFRNLLIRCGYKEEDIKEPDMDDSVPGTADFLVKDVVFEVKEIVPNAEEKRIINKTKAEIEKRKVSTNYVSDKTDQFRGDIQSARNKFKKYPNLSTVLVEDVVNWWWNEPDIEKMLFGEAALHLDKKTLDVSGYTWQNRLLRLDNNRSIGCYIFITALDIRIYHNVMAYNSRMLSVDTIKKFMNISSKQYFFINVPKSPPLIRSII